MTNRDKTIAGLRACGWVESARKHSAKYAVFENGAEMMLVGRSGALRKARGGRISSSFSMTGSRWHKALQTVGERAGQYSSVEQAQADLRFLLGEPAAAGAAALKGGA